MEVKNGRIPPGPQEKYGTTDDLLDWMNRQFNIFGDIYKASVYGTSVYATRDIEFAHHVLVENWQNYVKGQMIGRVALHGGRGGPQGGQFDAGSTIDRRVGSHGHRGG